MGRHALSGTSASAEIKRNWKLSGRTYAGREVSLKEYAKILRDHQIILAMVWLKNKRRSR